METQAPALPVPPLTEEQKTDLFSVCGDFYSDGRRMNWGASDSRWRRYRERATPEATLSLLAENARLSRLLEEERRTVAELRERASDWVPIGYGLPSTRHDGLSDMVLVCIKGEPVVGPHILVKGSGKNNYFWMENGRPGSVEGITHWLQYPGKPTPAAPCQRDCQKCESGKPGWAAVFATEADYDASVAEVCSRIASGEIKPREVELAQLHRCDLCDDSPCGLCPEHASRFGGGAGVGLQGEPNPYHIPSAKQAREMAHHTGYSTKPAPAGLQGEEGGGRG